MTTLTLILLAAGAVAALPQNRPSLKAEPFPLDEVRLTGGPWLDAEKADAAFLLTVNPDRLLHSFREHSGLKAKAPLYGGWEDSGLAGHSLGHYLSACSQQYASSGDKRFKDKVDYIVDELTECQKNRPDGYIAAMPDGDRVWAEVAKGQITTHGFDLNGLWSPWYTHHKVLAGLLDAHHLTGSKKALVVAEKFADWAINITKNLTDEQWQKMLICEYGGMNEVLAELYAVTGQQKYLDLSRKFYDRRVLDPLSKGVDDLAGKHSNTQIPKIIGLARLYEVSGDDKDRKTAEFFWDSVVNHHTYVIGGNSDHEYLGPADKLAENLSTNTCETCNTYNMLKLTRHLFEWDPKPQYADFYERAHLNDILASQDPADGMMCYFVPLSSGAHRTYSDPEDTWTCCFGSGMENHTKHQDSVYFHSGKDRLFVNQFIPTELNWREAGVKLSQSTDFPTGGKVAILIEQGGSRPLAISIRHPGWAKDSIAVEVNGKAVATSSSPDTYIDIRRRWKAGDKLEFTLPMKLRTESMPDDPKRIAMLYGPVVLAADLGPSHGPMPRTPVLVTNEQPVDDWAKPEGAPDQFQVKEAGRPDPLTLRPFYQIHHDRYAVYFDEFTQDQWDKAEADFRAKEAAQKDLEARTLDFARIGEMQPERDHQLKSEKNDVRDANGRGFRTPLVGGWFELQLKVSADQPVDLVMTYFGNRRLRPDFNILVDGQKIAEETLPDMQTNAFFDKTYPLPEELTRGKQTITVRVEAVAERPAGSVCGARTVRRPATIKGEIPPE